MLKKINTPKKILKKKISLHFSSIINIKIINNKVKQLKYLLLNIEMSEADKTLVAEGIAFLRKEKEALENNVYAFEGIENLINQILNKKNTFETDVTVSTKPVV